MAEATVTTSLSSMVLRPATEEAELIPVLGRLVGRGAASDLYHTAANN